MARYSFERVSQIAREMHVITSPGEYSPHCETTMLGDDKAAWEKLAELVNELLDIVTDPEEV